MLVGILWLFITANLHGIVSSFFVLTVFSAAYTSLIMFIVVLPFDSGNEYRIIDCHCGIHAAEVDYSQFTLVGVNGIFVCFCLVLVQVWDDLYIYQDQVITCIGTSGEVEYQFNFCS